MGETAAVETGRTDIGKGAHEFEVWCDLKYARDYYDIIKVYRDMTKVAANVGSGH